MTSRDRKCDWIKKNHTDWYGSFDDAVDGMFRRFGLGFFTDEQIDQITSEMVRQQRFHNTHMVQQRKHLRKVP